MAAWAPRVPFAKARLQADDGTLGLLLLCLGAGSLATMPLAGGLAARLGCRRVIWAASLVIYAALPLLATASSVPGLAAALLLFGAGVGTVDVAINIQAVIVERAAQRSMMSGFHGLFSVGGIAGAAGVNAVLWAARSPLLAASCVAAIIVAVLLGFAAALVPYGGDRDGPAFALPRGPVLLIGALCFVSFLAEGAMLDWGALVLTTVHGIDPVRSGLGYAVFSIAMTAGRLTGDRVVRVLGGRTVLAGGGVCASAGMALVALAPSQALALAGFGFGGLGASNIVPVLFSLLGRQRAMPANLAVAAVTTLGYSGILAGPAGIGFVAQAAGLTAAFVGLAALLLVIAACSGMATDTPAGTDRGAGR